MAEGGIVLAHDEVVAVARTDEPTYTDLVHEVLRESSEPLPFPEIVERVGKRREITTKNPKATVRSAINQSRLLAATGDGRYGYTPRLITGSLLRIRFADKRPANRPLGFPDEIQHALSPDFFEPDKRKLDRRVTLRLPTGEVATLTLGFVDTGTWGSPMPEALRAYLIEHHASAGDSLLIRIVDGERGECEARFESRLKRDEAAMARRNQEIADAAAAVLTKARDFRVPIWDLAVALLVAGAYRAEPAPDSLMGILGSDPRFVSAGFRMWALAERLSPEERVLVERSRSLLERLASPGPSDDAELDTRDTIESRDDPLRSRRSMERTFTDLHALLEGQELGSVEEANAWLQNVLAGGGPPRRKPATPLEQAQDLMYEAWEAGSERERVRLARKALEVSPDCADAYVLLAEETAHSAREAADLYARGVAAGERALGPAFFDEERGHFWGLVETRPYMRARHGLAQALWALGKRREAIGHLQAMLDLNPGDNQGVRYLLLDWLLLVGDDPAVASLLARYPDDGMAGWAFGAALHAFRTDGDTARSRDLLRQANETNPHVAPYLLGRKHLPRTRPQMIGLGDDSEAVDCAVGQMAAWQSARGALDWLRQQAPRG